MGANGVAYALRDDAIGSNALGFELGTELGTKPGPTLGREPGKGLGNRLGV